MYEIFWPLRLIPRSIANLIMGLIRMLQVLESLPSNMIGRFLFLSIYFVPWKSRSTSIFGTYAPAGLGPLRLIAIVISLPSGHLLMNSGYLIFSKSLINGFMPVNTGALNTSSGKSIDNLFSRIASISLMNAFVKSEPLYKENKDEKLNLNDLLFIVL